MKGKLTSPHEGDRNCNNCGRKDPTAKRCRSTARNETNLVELSSKKLVKKRKFAYLGIEVSEPQTSITAKTLRGISIGKQAHKIKIESDICKETILKKNAKSGQILQIYKNFKTTW